MQINETADGTPDRPAPLETQLCFAVYGAAHAFTRAYKPLLEPLGLTYPQYLVMLVLWEEDGQLPDQAEGQRRDQPAGQSVRAIGDRMGLDSGTLSPLLKRLEQAGLVTRARDRQDERQVLVSLTARGREMRRDAAAVNRAIVSAVGCGAKEAEALRDSLLALADRLADQPS